MRHYELTYLASPKLDEEKVIQINETINIFVQGKGGILGLTERPKNIQLAYPIKKFSTAWLVTNDFYIDESLLPEFKKLLDENKDVIRYLIILKEGHKYGAPQKVTLERTTEPTKESEKEPTKDDSKPTGKEKAPLEDLDKKLEEIL
ncbi:30S ribosomal protein S6 [bacterium HR34]|nr:30S ribosomal protein S6 [bacterium HR34]